MLEFDRRVRVKILFNRCQFRKSAFYIAGITTLSVDVLQLTRNSTMVILSHG